MFKYIIYASFLLMFGLNTYSIDVETKEDEVLFGYYPDTKFVPIHQDETELEKSGCWPPGKC
jgi:hypothetical protein